MYLMLKTNTFLTNKFYNTLLNKGLGDIKNVNNFVNNFNIRVCELFISQQLKC